MLFIKIQNQNGTERKAHFFDLEGSEPDAVEPSELDLDRERRDLLPERPLDFLLDFFLDFLGGAGEDDDEDERRLRLRPRRSGEGVGCRSCSRLRRMFPSPIIEKRFADMSENE